MTHGRQEISAVSHCKSNVEKLSQALEHAAIDEEGLDMKLEQELEGLKNAIPTFVSMNMGLLGLLTPQAEMALALGDFDTAFEVLVRISLSLLHCCCLNIIIMSSWSSIAAVPGD